MYRQNLCDGMQPIDTGRYPRPTKKPAIAGFFVCFCFCFYLTLRDTAVWSPRQESNLYLALRRRPFYPLNYGEADSPAF